MNYLITLLRRWFGREGRDPGSRPKAVVPPEDGLANESIDSLPSRPAVEPSPAPAIDLDALLESLQQELSRAVALCDQAQASKLAEALERSLPQNLARALDAADLPSEARLSFAAPPQYSIVQFTFKAKTAAIGAEPRAGEFDAPLQLHLLSPFTSAIDFERELYICLDHAADGVVQFGDLLAPVQAGTRSGPWCTAPHVPIGS